MKKVIVVDPDKKFWKDVEKVINTDICEVIFLENGQSLMGKLKEEDFDLIILNLELPDKNGFIYCNQIKKDSKLKNIPIIITSSEKTQQDFEQHKKLKVRADEYLQKPISIATLKNTIKNFHPDIILEPKLNKQNNQKEETHIKVDDFDEENIDKLLDETFVGLIEEEPKPTPPKESVDNSDTSVLQKQIEELVEENMTLKQQIEELQGGTEGEKILKEENEKLKEEITQLKEKMRNLEKESESELEKENQKLKGEVDELKKQIDKMEAELNQKKEELKELNVQLIATQKEKGFLEKENREHLMSITSLKADFEEKLHEQENLISALQTEKESLFNQLNEATNELEEKNKFILTLQEESAKLKEDTKTLNQKLNSMEQELNELREFKTNTENQIVEQNTLISNLQRDLNIAREAKSALEETVFDLKEETKTIQMEVENKAKENELLKQKLSESEERIRKLEEKIEKIRQITSE
ncbi:hypothetical protein TTHT_1451 [Thermotomaculum hydrothermale]|uniref:Response regulatory domain-containing protein n=1 Tax=Thermotomaculum hydrothermale TaxID=981385 RepID=A0A7R6PPL6_9BACT|nr:response regulator [Thermotomaculum hydrothermale]BBB32961.1 hypothetical protein TTHT_1451 [Thermotomaculum hydrothermale]